MTKDTVLSELQKAVPHFRLNPEWLDDGLAYPAINNLARFICSEEYPLESEDVDAALAFLERALSDGDGYVRDLVIECLETINSCESIDILKDRFPPGLRALWGDRFESQR